MPKEKEGYFFRCDVSKHKNNYYPKIYDNLGNKLASGSDSKFATILWEAHINNLIIKDVYESFNKEKFHDFIDNNLENIYEDINKSIINFYNTNKLTIAFSNKSELVSVIKKAVPKGARADGPHPAKRTFQAIRIEVNNELGILEDTINSMVDILKSGGRICIITFHSLEDRIVKNVFRNLENPCTCPRDFPICVCGKKPKVKVITRKPIAPSKEELEVNHRSRSAKLRIVEKL